ncbi:hypothetical protein [Vibrio parahaemolyticus]|uniref:hypothetical protein n=2 Tax=Vibrionaceae TaxID=641 RepID=UPI00215269E3|nr:hypothetical protein [Vibrio parahaemolyticus]
MAKFRVSVAHTLMRRYVIEEEMTEVLDIIDKAIKRLVAPAAMLVAAELLSRGMDKADANPVLIKFTMAVLALWALGYMVFSAKEAMQAFDEANIGKYKNALLSTSFLIVYFVLAAAAIRLGFDKIT